MKGPQKGFSPLAEINVTPLVDVMLVLLIIFMVTAPMMQQGLEVDLPRAEGKGFSEDTQLIVSISKGKKIFLGDKPVSHLNKLSLALQGSQEKEVLIKADATVPYGFVVQVMAAIKKSGIEKIGMITNPEE